MTAAAIRGAGGFVLFSNPDYGDEWLREAWQTRTTQEQQDVYDMLHHGSTWKRYSIVDDEIKVERVEPSALYWPVNEERRYMVTSGRRGLYTRMLREAIARADPPRPWYALPQLERRTPTYLAVQLLLDSYVN